MQTPIQGLGGEALRGSLALVAPPKPLTSPVRKAPALFPLPAALETNPAGTGLQD